MTEILIKKLYLYVFVSVNVTIALTQIRFFNASTFCKCCHSKQDGCLRHRICVNPTLKSIIKSFLSQRGACRASLRADWLRTSVRTRTRWHHACGMPANQLCTNSVKAMSARLVFLCPSTCFSFSARPGNWFHFGLGCRKAGHSVVGC